MGKRISCEYNQGVWCSSPDCSRCGWNPEVEERRKTKLLGTVEVYDEDRQRVIGRVKWPVLGCMEDQYR